MAQTREAGAELLLVINGSPYEREQGRHPAGAVRPPRGARPAARWPTSTWSAARTSWSSTATRSSSTPAARCSPAAPQFARGPAGRRPRPRRRAPSTRPARPRASCTSPSRPSRSRRTPPSRRRAPPGWTTSARSTRRWCSGCGDYVRKNGFRSVAARPLRRHRLGAGGGHRRRRARRRATSSASRCPSALLQPSTAGTTPPSWPSGSARTTASSRSSRWSAPSWTTLELTGVAEENLQARVRGADAGWGCPTSEGHLVLATSNKSELVGRLLDASTATASAASPRSRTCPRRWSGSSPGGATPRRCAAARCPPIPESTIVKPPSAELRPGQIDQDSLPPYDVLDAMLDAYVERRPGPRRAARGRLRRGRRRPGRHAGRPGGVEAPPVRPRPEDLAAWPSAATAGCRSPAGGASRTPDRARPARPSGRPSLRPRARP